MAESPLPRLSFGRASRLKQRGDFARAKAEGRRLVCGCLIANILLRPQGQPSRLGVVTSRKMLGGAVARSRARRLLRESFRLHQHDLTRPVDLVLIARSSITGKKRADVEMDLQRVLRQARLDLAR